MTAGDSENERLRRAFGDGAGEPSTSRTACPSNEEVWQAARGELEPSRRREFLNHLLECDACAQSCSIACELISTKSGRDSRGWAWIALPAAALLIVGLVWIAPFDRLGGTPVDEFRQLDAATIDSLLDESIPLPRDRCVLRWTAGPEGTLYSVAISSESLTVLAREDELDQPSYKVPEPLLESVPAGATFLWRVEALLPDATRVTSPVFRAELE